MPDLDLDSPRAVYCVSCFVAAKLAKKEEADTMELGMLVDGVCPVCGFDEKADPIPDAKSPPNPMAALKTTLEL